MPSLSVAEFSIPTANSTAFSITAGADGNIWFTETGGNKIGRISLAGAITEFSAPGAPGGITAGPDGALWFTEIGGNKIGRMTTAGVITNEFAIPTPGAAVHEITTGSDGALWFAEAGTDKIGRITTSGVVTEFSTGLAAGSTPFDIVSGPDGALWFTEINGDKIGCIDPTSHAITQFNVAPHPSMITAGPDGALWFSESDVLKTDNANTIGRLTTTGSFTQFSPPTANSVPQGITVGPDGALGLPRPAAIISVASRPTAISPSSQSRPRTRLPSQS